MCVCVYTQFRGYSRTLPLTRCTANTKCPALKVTNTASAASAEREGSEQQVCRCMHTSVYVKLPLIPQEFYKGNTLFIN